ncbi:MAG: tRNA lysidine(34) synthetase TilS, partial [Clostridia bacterium]|nr:tRNA lysidine(34) synthetase TilS [Clostridia bacterium]
MNTNTLLVREKAKKAIEKHKMLNKGDTVVVGLSGGADSVCLLHFLNSIKTEYNLTIISAHINHGIRGEEAEKDALFSKTFSENLNVDFRLLKVDCVNEAKKNGETVEEAGRRIRYEFFNSLIGKENSVIATAHNSNDNMETIIFNITRGSSLNGAKGIPPKREIIIRPLIFCTREEIEGYCKENSLEF